MNISSSLTETAVPAQSLYDDFTNRPSIECWVDTKHSGCLPFLPDIPRKVKSTTEPCMHLLLLPLLMVATMAAWADTPQGYEKRSTWQESLEASLEQERATEGLQLSNWYSIGPFTSPSASDLHRLCSTPFAPETEPLDLARDLGKLRWAVQPGWHDGTVNRIGNGSRCVYYLTRTITSPDDRRVKVYLGTDDSGTVWLNGQQLFACEVARFCLPDQAAIDLNLRAGENRLTIKISNLAEDAAFYFSLRPHGADGEALRPIWEELIRNFPDAAQQMAWVREDGIFNNTTSRYYRYDDPQVAFSGSWQYTAAGSPNGVARRSEMEGDTACVDFVGDHLTIAHKFGSMEKNGILSREAEQIYGQAALTLDGRPWPADRALQRDSKDRSVIDTGRGPCQTPGIAPGLHRLTITNVGCQPGKGNPSNVVAILGFTSSVEPTAPRPARRAWQYAVAVRGGKVWQEQAARLASQAKDSSGLEALEQLYFASRQVDGLASQLRALRDRPPASKMVERENSLWQAGPSSTAYFEHLSQIKSRAQAALAQADGLLFNPAQLEPFKALLAQMRGVADEAQTLFAAEVGKLAPIIFFTGEPLSSTAVPNYIWSGNPLGNRWGCSIRIWDPAHPGNPPKVIFEDPKAIILDLNLSYDAKTVFFSARRNGEQYWQIYEISIEGKDLKQITRGEHYNVCPVPLPDGRVAFLSSRTPGSHTVCQSGPSMHVHVMDRDGNNARDLSTNTLTDFGLSILEDGRLIFTRWEYVDADLGARQSLWTLFPDGRQFQLYGGNCRTDPSTFWQAREIPGHGAVVCTFAPHHGSPYGAIGIVSRRLGVDGQRDEGFRWITEEFPVIEDQNHFWAYRDPYPISDRQFLVSYGGGSSQRFRIYLLDDVDNKTLVYEDKSTGCFYPQLVKTRPLPKGLPDMVGGEVKTIDVAEAAPGQPAKEKVAVGFYFVQDVYRGMGPEVARGRVKSIRIMEQIPKTVNTTWYRAYDQGPLMSAVTYYAKRCWGYAPVEEDGSAWFEAPAGKELYFQTCDEQGRELRRMTSGTQLAPGETQSCIGCHESRDSVAPNRSLAVALRRPPTPVAFPEWGNAGVIDYVRVIQPILDRHCVSCHSGTAPKGNIFLSGGLTRFFNMSYDNLVVRSQSAQVSTDRYLGLSADLPLVQVNPMFPGIYTAHPSLSTGSVVSRLPGFFEKSHCGSEVSAEEKRRLYEWIDAMAPYYTTYYSARPGSRGDRDRWGDNREPKKIADWYTQGFTPVYERRCQSCHGPIPLDAAYQWGGKWGWIDLSRPDWSPALNAHLSKEAGGRGITEKDFGQLLTPRWMGRRSFLLGRWASLQNDYRVLQAALAAGGKLQPFRDTNDPDYQAMLKAIRQGAASMAELPEADMPGFVNRSANNGFGGKH